VPPRSIDRQPAGDVHRVQDASPARIHHLEPAIPDQEYPRAEDRDVADRSDLVGVEPREEPPVAPADVDAQDSAGREHDDEPSPGAHAVGVHATADVVDGLEVLAARVGEGSGVELAIVEHEDPPAVDGHPLERTGGDDVDGAPGRERSPEEPAAARDPERPAGNVHGTDGADLVTAQRAKPAGIRSPGDDLETVLAVQDHQGSDHAHPGEVREVGAPRVLGDDLRLGRVGQVELAEAAVGEQCDRTIQLGAHRDRPAAQGNGGAPRFFGRPGRDGHEEPGPEGTRALGEEDRPSAAPLEDGHAQVEGLRPDRLLAAGALEGHLGLGQHAGPLHAALVDLGRDRALAVPDRQHPVHAPRGSRDEEDPGGTVGLLRPLGEHLSHTLAIRRDGLQLDTEGDAVQASRRPCLDQTLGAGRLGGEIALGMLGRERRQQVGPVHEAAMAEVVDVAPGPRREGPVRKLLEEVRVGRDAPVGPGGLEASGLEHRLELRKESALGVGLAEASDRLRCRIAACEQVVEPLACLGGVRRAGRSVQEVPVGGRRVLRARLVPAIGGAAEGDGRADHQQGQQGGQRSSHSNPSVFREERRRRRRHRSAAGVP
jgi:hypothetical protein